MGVYNGVNREKFRFETDRQTHRQTQGQVHVLSCASQLKTFR